MVLQGLPSLRLFGQEDFQRRKWNGRMKCTFDLFIFVMSNLRQEIFTLVNQFDMVNWLRFSSHF